VTTDYQKPNKLDEFDAWLNILVKALEGSTYSTRQALSNLIGKILAFSQTSLVNKSPKKQTDKKANLESSKQDETILTFDAMLSLLRAYYIKCSMKEARIGLVESFVAILQTVGPQTVESHFPTLVRHLAEWISDPKLTGTDADIVFLRESGSFVVRNVALRMLSEQAQISALRELFNIWTEFNSSVKSDLAVVFILNEVAYLVDELGSSISSLEELLVEKVPNLIGQVSPKRNVASAKALRSICSSLPKLMPRILDQLISVLQRDIGSLNSDKPESLPRYTACGHDLASVICVVHKHSTRVSFESLAVIFGIATQLLKASSSNKDLKVAATQAHVAWTLIGSLMTVGPGFVAVHISQLLLTWKNYFPKSTPKDLPKSDVEVYNVFTSKTASLSALNSFLLHNSGQLTTVDVLKRVVVSLNNALHFLTLWSNNTANVNLGSSGTEKRHKMTELDNAFRKRLFNCYALIKPESCFETSYEQLVSSAIQTFAPDPESINEKASAQNQSERLHDLFTVSSYVTKIHAGQTDRNCLSLLALHDTDVSRVERLVSIRLSVQNQFYH
jgi:hypothetical protein